MVNYGDEVIFLMVNYGDEVTSWWLTMVMK